MKNPFSYLFRARDKPQNAVSAAPSFYFGMSGSGKSVSPQLGHSGFCRLRLRARHRRNHRQPALPCV